MGIPSGRFSSLPGFGIQTLRAGNALLEMASSPTRSSRSFGVSDLTPSTLAVFFPWFSCVTRRTAKHLADQDFTSNLLCLRTVRLSPRRFCSVNSFLQLENHPF